MSQRPSEMPGYTGSVEIVSGDRIIPARADLYDRQWTDTTNPDARKTWREWGGKLYPEDGNLGTLFDMNPMALRFPDGAEEMAIPIEFKRGSDHVEVRGSRRAPWNIEESDS